MPTVIRDPTPAWLKPENASVLDSYWTRIARAIAPWVGGDDPASQVMGIAAPLEVPGGLTPLRQLVKGAKATATKAANKVIRAYHGSPHDFEMFALSKIGTGEGAQAYGHGLYFAEKEGTARSYRDALGQALKVGDRSIPFMGGTKRGLSNAEDLATQMLALTNNDLDKAIALATEKAALSDRRGAVLQPAVDQLKAWKQAGHVPTQVNSGRMYEVNIRARPEEFLDWDAPLKDQPANVKAAANDLFRGRLETRDVGPDLVDVREKGGGSLGVYPRAKVPEVLANPADYYPYRGRELYRQIEMERAVDRGAWTNPSEYASQELKEIYGVPGIKYLDQNSRAAGQGTRNFVVFDDKLIDIVRKYGIAGALAGGLINESQARQMRAQGIS